MQTPAKMVSLVSLAAVIVPCIIHFIGAIDLDTVKLLALIGTIGWFASTPLWMSREVEIDDREVQI